MHRSAPLLAVLVALLAPAAAHAADPTPFGHACKAQDGVRFCPGGGDTPSWDGVPLDVDVTLPAEGNGPFPTIAMLHGYGGSKANFQATDPEDTRSGGQVYRYNNTWFARRGYAVVNHTARGFAQSCGQPPAKLQPGCFTGRGGYIHLKDQRVEAHDTQFLLGSLVDAGLTRPDAIGVTGISYGGGESIELAFLRDRIRNTDGTFAPWTSPKGTPLRIAAAWPRWPWSDLVASLVPNGRFLDFKTPGLTDSRTPIGIPIQSYISGLYALGNQSGSYAPPGTDTHRRHHAVVRAHRRRRPVHRPVVTGIADEIFNVPPGLRPRRHARAAAHRERLDRRPLPAARGRCGSTTACAPRTRAPTSPSRSATSATAAGRTSSTPTRRSTRRAAPSSTPSSRAPPTSRAPRPAASPPSPRPARRTRRRPGRSARARGSTCTRARCASAASPARRRP